MRLHVSTASRYSMQGRLVPVVAFSVIDSGIGIPPDKHNVIFEAFQQADMGTARKYGGTGLGLAISREIAGLLGGEMTVSSEPDVGSAFTFFHPLARQSRDADPATRAIAPLRGRTPPRRPTFEPSRSGGDAEIVPGRDRVVLIVEDDATFAQIIGQLASERGFKPLVAA